MKQISTTEDIVALGTILSVWAHPDDESFLAAGILATAAKNGQFVACVTATKGEKGSQDEEKWPLETLGEVRTKELEKACQILGVSKHFWLDYIDGECDKIPKQAAVDKINTIIKETQPDTILTFGPDGLTGHSDHAAVSLWADAAAKQSGRKITVYHCVHTPDQYEKYLKKLDAKLDIFFNIDKPPLLVSEKCDIHFKLPAEICGKKREALAAQPSQTEAMLRLFDEKTLDNALEIEAFVLAP